MLNRQGSQLQCRNIGSHTGRPLLSGVSLFRLTIYAALLLITPSELYCAQALPARHTTGRKHGSVTVHTGKKVSVSALHTSESQISHKHSQAVPLHDRPSTFSSKQSQTIPVQNRSDTFSSIGRVSRSSWSFIHGKQGDRDAVLEAQNLCWSPQAGVFYLGDSGRRKNFSQDFPAINLIASAPERDHYWRPSKQVKAAVSSHASFRYLLNTTLFVMGATWPYHMSHFFANNGLPLLDVMRTYYQDWDLEGEWLHRRHHLAVFPSSSSMFEAIQAFKFETIVSAQAQSEGKAAAHSGHITCYAHAVIGLNNTCGHNFCANHHADKRIYRFLRDMMWKHYLAPSEATQAFAVVQGLQRLTEHAVIVQRKRNRHIVNVNHITAEFDRHNISHETVYLESMSFRRQVHMFTLRSTIVVAVHGNAIGHFLWAQKQTLFIEIFPYEWHSDWQELLIKETWKAGPADSTGVRYAKIECLDSSCSQGMKGLNADVSVNCTELGRLLDVHVSL